MAIDMKRSRTILLTDAEWRDVGKAAKILGFGGKGRGRLIAALAREVVAGNLKMTLTTANDDEVQL